MKKKENLKPNEQDKQILEGFKEDLEFAYRVLLFGRDAMIQGNTPFESLFTIGEHAWESAGTELVIFGNGCIIRKLKHYTFVLSREGHILLTRPASTPAERIAIDMYLCMIGGMNEQTR